MMNTPISNRPLWRGLFFAALCLAAAPGWSQELYYATSSAAQSSNTVEYVSPGGGANHSSFTATGATGNGVIRCTAIALDSSAQKVFLLDAAGQSIWSMNLSGGSLALVITLPTSTPTDLALDTVNQEIYFTTSSSTQTNNTIQKVGYSGTGRTVLFTATGPFTNGVSRCTALALDLLHSQILFSDAGMNALWSINLAGGNLASVNHILPGAPLDLALDVTNQLVYYVTSSWNQSSNTVQRITYGGANNTLLLTAPGGTGVQRCTALEFDPVASKLYLADAGASVLWSLNPDGTGVAALETGVFAIPRRMHLLPSTPVTVINFSDSGPGSLRQAILGGGVFTTIVFSSGLFSSSSGVLNLVTVGDTTFGPSSLLITNNVSINSPVGSNGLVIARSNGASAMRLFYVAPGGSLTLQNVTLTNGLSQGGDGGSGSQRGGSGGGGAGMGGAILNWGALDLENSTLVGNQALGGAGGGGYGGGGEGSGGGGGGMGGPGGAGGGSSTGGYGGPPTGGDGGTGTGSGDSGGLAGGGGGGGSGGIGSIGGYGSGEGGASAFGGGGGGGGAYNTEGYGGGVGGIGGAGGFGGGGGGGGGGTPGGTNGSPGFGGGAGGATGDNSGNIGSAGGGGAGLGGAVFSVYGPTTITNCTFSGNVAAGGAGGYMFGSLGSNGLGFGGGIFNVDCSLAVLNATFASNQASQGGAICNLGYGESSSVFLRNSILADSISAASDYLSTNVSESANSDITNSDLGNNNLIQVNCGFAGGIVSTADPLLTPLQDNGGPTWTHALMNRSPAIDAGDNTALPATDQRGYPRIADGNGDGLAIVDLGAVEDGLVLLTAMPQTAQSIASYGFMLSLTGETNRNYVLEYSANLVNWYSLSTNLVPPAGLMTLFDPSANNSPRQRYYRAFAIPH
jgi:hypothetical protein